MASTGSELLADARGRLREIDSQLANLEKEKTRLSVVIDYLEAKIGPSKPRTEDRSAEITPPAPSGPFVDLTIVESAERWLSEVGPPHRDTNELIAGLEAGGFRSEAKNVYTSIYGTLNRETAKENSKLEKKDGKWGLRAWQQPPLGLEQVDSEEGAGRDEGRPRIAAMPSLGR